MSADAYKDIEKLEDDLWAAADNLRANSKLTSSDYFMPVLGVIFLRHAANRFEAAHRQIQEDQATGKMPKRKVLPADYLRRRALWLPETARYDFIMQQAATSGSDLPKLVTEAMTAIEAEFEPLNGVLPKDFGIFETKVLEDLMRLFNSEQIKQATGDVFGRIYEYFLAKFSIQKAHDNGEFFTPSSLVQTRIGGAAQPNASAPVLGSFEFPLPSRHAQTRIADILATYDNLIENNRRRMALLEDAARQLYREWFVRLRFPGHEHTRITNGVPEGWQRQKLAELCESIDYGYTASAELDEIGPKFLRITDIVPDVIDWTSVPYCPIEEDRLAKFRLVEGDIVIARTGATVGYAKRLHKRHPEAVFASYLVRLRLKPEIDSLMVGIFVESADYKSYVQSRVSGAAQPNANAKVLAAAEILVPPPSIQRVFQGSVEPLMDQREVLQLQNQQLRAARDILLPRLMSGEIAV